MANKYSWYYLTGSGGEVAHRLIRRVEKIDKDFKLRDAESRRLWRILNAQYPMTLSEWDKFITLIRRKMS